MPTVDYVASVEVQRTVRLRQVASMFDMEPTTSPTESWSFEMELPDEWQIGLIVGPSGSGKTTLGEYLFSNDPTDHYRWPTDKCILDGFGDAPGTTVKSITQALSSVGFSSPPSWLKPFAVLSTGEQFRANLARAVHDLSESSVTLVDEFTSTVDRTVARTASLAVSKAVRRTNSQFVAVTCHYDVEDWLQPDWVLEMPAGKLRSRRCLRRPSIELRIERCHHSRWQTYSRHHYLDTSVAHSAHCYEATWNDRPVAFAAVMSFPHAISPGWREHRIVCLPDFQGAGIGMGFSNYIASAYAHTGKPYRSVTTHPAMIAYRKRSGLWATVRPPSRVSPLLRKGRQSSSRRFKQSAVNRMTATHQYIGPTDEQAYLALGLERK